MPKETDLNDYSRICYKHPHSYPYLASNEDDLNDNIRVRLNPLPSQLTYDILHNDYPIIISLIVDMP